MPTSDSAPAPSATLLTRRNLILVAVALVTIAAGYAVLVSGAPGVAAVLLVAGYCVLFPLALLA